MSDTNDTAARPSVNAIFERAKALHQEGKLAEAERLYEEVLRVAPDRADALELLGVIVLISGRAQRGAEIFSRVVELAPDNSSAHSNLGFALNALHRYDEALVSCDKSIALNPHYAGAHNNRGITLYALGRHEDAIVSYQQAVAVQPNYAEAYNNLGNTLKALGRHEEALANYDKAIAIKPNYAEPLSNRGVQLRALNRHKEAAISQAKAVALRPDFADAHYNLGNALRDLERFDDALTSYGKAIALKPDYAEAHQGRGKTFESLGRFEEALASFKNAFAFKPDCPFLLGDLIAAKTQICDWSDMDGLLAALQDKVGRGLQASTPFAVLSVSNSPSLQRKSAEIYSHALFPPKTTLPEIAKYPRHEKIRLGYFSADFHHHATTILAAEMFERHDRKKFELFAFSFGADPGDKMAQRARRAFDQFIDVRGRSDKDVALLARQLEIDIAIDLKGHTGSARQNIFAFRAAPLQIHYLGYPGTQGAGYIDYLVADPTLIPETHQRHYREKIVYLPHSYQANDSKRRIAERSISRAKAGLPEGAFVFCCFNNNYKITPEMFDRWMRIMKRVEGSVMWLLEGNKTARANLMREARRHGVDEERLIFAPRMLLPDHLARHSLADLFLDTLPCNAHTTASDALWAGLPVLTERGETFAGRVAASLLNAIGLSELIVTTPRDYVALAVDLASNPEKLREIKNRVAANRNTAALFDVARFTRHIETGYAAAYERYRADLPADHIYVPSGR